jgi:uncharacterized membrane protein YccC
MSMSAAVRSASRPPVLQVAKSAVATVVAWLLAGWLIPGPLPVFAAIAALLVVQPSLNQSFSKGVERTVGVVLGVVVAAALGALLGETTWSVLLAIVAALALAWVLRVTPGTANQIAISAMLVLALGAATPGYAIDRVIETLLGAVVGFVVNVALVPPVSVAPARAAVAAAGTALAGSMEALAAALRRSPSAGELTAMLTRARGIRPLAAVAEGAIAAARESLTLNPRARRHKAELAALAEVIERITPIGTQLIGMTRAYVDRYEPTLAAEPEVAAIAEQLDRAAHDVRLLLDQAAGLQAGASAAVDAEPPALTRPLRIAAPSAGHWVLIGSLLVDLERIHTALQEALGEA